MTVGKISDRHIKPESEKKIKLILMYLLLLDSGAVYDFELGLDCSNKSQLRSFERYAEELYNAGAIPKPHVSKKKVLDSYKDKDENGKDKYIYLYYYEYPEVKLEFAQKDTEKRYDSKLKMEIPLINPYKPLYESEYAKTHHFKYRKSNPTSIRLARVLAMIYYDRTRMGDLELKSGMTRLENYYFKYLNPGASRKSWQRDRDLWLYAVLYLYADIENIKSKYKEYIRKIRNEKPITLQ